MYWGHTFAPLTLLGREATCSGRNSSPLLHKHPIMVWTNMMTYMSVNKIELANECHSSIGPRKSKKFVEFCENGSCHGPLSQNSTNVDILKTVWCDSCLTIGAPLAWKSLHPLLYITLLYIALRLQCTLWCSLNYIRPANHWDIVDR